MTAYVHLRYFAHFFIERKKFEAQTLETIKTHITFNYILPKIVPFMRNMEKYGTAGQATDDNIIQRMRIECWTTKATDTYSEYLLLCHGNNGKSKEPQHYVFTYKQTNKLRGLSPHANYTDRAAAAGRRS